MKLFKSSQAYSHAVCINLILLVWMLVYQPAYSQDPILAWTQYSDLEGGARVVISDAAANAYVASEIVRDGNKNVLTIKYSATGTELWRREFTGALRRDDIPVSIALDGLNNVYVLAKTVESGDKAAMALIKYNVDGLPVWIRIFRAPATGASPVAVAVDPTTNDIVVCAYASMEVTSRHYGILIVKYSPAGTMQWERFFTSAVSGDISSDVPKVLKIDPSGSIYIGGKTVTHAVPIPPPLGDQLLVKYASDGTKLWERHFNYDISVGLEPGSADEVSDIAFDADGNIYAAGGGIVEGFRRCYGSLAKYRSDGTELWRTFKWVEREHSDYPDNARIAFYNTENIYLAFDNGGAVVTTKFNSEGRILWDRSHRFRTLRYVSVRSAQVDTIGNVSIAASFNNFRLLSNFYSLALQYNPSGTLNWDITPTSEATFSDYAGLHINADNTFFIIGARLFGVGGVARDFIEKYRFPLPSPPPGTPSTIIMPESFEPFERVDFDIYARDRGWCWTDLLIGWECLVPPFCSDPFFSAELTYNEKATWQMDFNKPIQAALPMNKDFQRFTLSMKVDDDLRDVIVVDEDLVKNGMERLSFSTHPKEKFVTVKASTVNGVDVHFSMNLFNKDGKSIWHQDFIAPFEKDISDMVSEPGTRLQFSGGSAPLKMNYYPNPFAEQLTVTIDKETNGSAEVAVYSLQGKKIVQQPVGDSGSTIIKMNGQKPGLYILVLKTDFSETRELIELK